MSEMHLTIVRSVPIRQRRGRYILHIEDNYHYQQLGTKENTM